MSNSEPISRDRAWVDREYGREKWPAMVRMIREIMSEEGEQPGLARVLARAKEMEIGSTDDPMEAVEAVVGGKLVRIPRSAAFGAYLGCIQWTVSHYCRSRQAELMVELGSGWGHNILALASGTGSAHAKYVGAEYTAAGREAAVLLASLAPKLPFRSVPFDYNRPDLTQLRGQKPAVIFTAHSVEQIRKLPEAVLDQIISLAPDVTCLHFEPVGWQFGHSIGSSEDYARRNDYSQNLAELLGRYQTDGRLTVEKVAVDVIGCNPANATSVIVWRSRDSLTA
jgi:hypothetical protein